MAEVAIRLIGEFQIDVGGTTVGVEDFERRTGAELAQLLALSPGRRLHRDQVLEALWPDRDPAPASNQLNKAVSFLRAALGTADALERSADQLALLPHREVSIDLREVLDADPDQPEQALAALELCSGDLLPTAAYADWSAAARRQYGDRKLDLLRRAGRFTEAIALAPYDEASYIGLMETQMRRGDRVAALQTFDALEVALQDHLGVSPSAAACDLADQIAGAADLTPVESSLRGLRTFLFTDVVGSTARWLDDEASMSTLMQAHDEQLRSVVHDHGGAVFSHTGDGIAAEFTSAEQAVRAAIEIQRQLTPDDDNGLRLRAGLDAGEAERREGNWFGIVVNRAARIMGAAAGGQILCSATVAGLTATTVGSEVEFHELGLHHLKDLPPTELCRLSSGRVGDVRTLPSGGRLSGQPVPVSPAALIGRDQELDRAQAHLDSTRLVSLVGPGGVGKTLLATHTARGVAHRFEGGAWMCELGRVADEGNVAQAVLDAIGARQQTDASVVESVIAALRARANLLVLDNCEHVLDGARALLRRLLDECPDLRVIATSRVALGLRGEVTLPIAQLTRAASCRLFANAAERAGALVDATEPILVRVCARLDDLPLALELAAARMRSIDLATLEELLPDRFDLLTSTDADLSHHETLHAAIAWSVDQLDELHTEVLADIATFADWFTLDAATHVAERDGRGRATVIAALGELVQRSLVASPVTRGGRTVYRLLESVRLFARALQTDERAADRHLAYFTDRAMEAGALSRAEPSQGFHLVREDWDDRRIAVQRASKTARNAELHQLLGSAGAYAITCLDFELLDWCAGSLEPHAAVESEAHAVALASWSGLLAIRNEVDLAHDLAQNAAGWFPEDSNVLWALAWGPWARGDLPKAAEYLDVIVETATPSSRTVTAGAHVLLSIIRFADGMDITTHTEALETMALSGGEIERCMADLSRGIRLVGADPEGSIDALQAAQAAADRHGLLNLSITARSAQALSKAFSADLLGSYESTCESLSYSSTRGMWAHTMATLGTAAGLIEAAGRPDIATTLLAAREASGSTAGFGAAMAVALAEQLRAAHVDDFDRWWAAGSATDKLAATHLATSVLEELVQAG